MKKKNYKENDVFVDSKINDKSQNTQISLLLVERFDLYMKLVKKIESLYRIGFVVSSRTRGSSIYLY